MMPDRRVYFRIREGGFFYLLGVEPGAASIEQRAGGEFEPTDEGGPLQVAWYGRIPVLRLGVLMRTRVGQWEYAVVLAGAEPPLAIAAAHVQEVPEDGRPAIQAFNPAGSCVPGGPVVTGVCPGTQPEFLVLDASRLWHSLLRARAVA